MKPKHVREKYYHARSPQGHNPVNRVVDISSHIDIYNLLLRFAGLELSAISRQNVSKNSGTRLRCGESC